MIVCLLFSAWSWHICRAPWVVRLYRGTTGGSGGLLGLHDVRSSGVRQWI